MDYYMSKIYIDYIELGITADEVISLFSNDDKIISYKRDNILPYVYLYSEMDINEFMRYAYMKIINYVKGENNVKRN